MDSIRALFNEKEKELSLAVAKVDELTRQLEELRRGGGSREHNAPASTLELDKLRKELMVRECIIKNFVGYKVKEMQKRMTYFSIPQFFTFNFHFISCFYQ